MREHLLGAEDVEGVNIVLHGSVLVVAEDAALEFRLVLLQAVLNLGDGETRHF